MYYISSMPLHSCASFSALPAVYGMMETRRRLPTEHQARRRQGGLCRGGGSSDRPPAPAGPGDLQHPQAAVPTRRGGPGGCEERSCFRCALYHSPHHAEASCRKRVREHHCWALPRLSHRPSHEERQDQSAHLKHDRTLDTCTGVVTSVTAAPW